MLFRIVFKASSPVAGWKSCACWAREWPLHPILRQLRVLFVSTTRFPLLIRSRHITPVSTPFSSSVRYALVTYQNFVYWMSPWSSPCSYWSGAESSFIPESQLHGQVGPLMAPQSCYRELVAVKFAPPPGSLLRSGVLTRSGVLARFGASYWTYPNLVDASIFFLLNGASGAVKKVRSGAGDLSCSWTLIGSLCSLILQVGWVPLRLGKLRQTPPCLSPHILLLWAIWTHLYPTSALGLCIMIVASRSPSTNPSSSSSTWPGSARFS